MGLLITTNVEALKQENIFFHIKRDSSSVLYRKADFAIGFDKVVPYEFLSSFNHYWRHSHFLKITIGNEEIIRLLVTTKNGRLSISNERSNSSYNIELGRVLGEPWNYAINVLEIPAPDLDPEPEPEEPPAA